MYDIQIFYIYYFRKLTCYLNLRNNKKSPVMPKLKWGKLGDEFSVTVDLLD